MATRDCSTCGKEITMAVHIKSGKRAPLIEDPDGTFILHQGAGGLPTYEHVGPPNLLDGPDERTRYKSHSADCAQAGQHRRKP